MSENTQEYRQSLDAEQIEKVVSYYWKHTVDNRGDDIKRIKESEAYFKYMERHPDELYLIKKGLQDGLDITKFCQTVPFEDGKRRLLFSSDRMNVIYKALQDGLDVTGITKIDSEYGVRPVYSADEMQALSAYEKLVKQFDQDENISSDLSVYHDIFYRTNKHDKSAYSAETLKLFTDLISDIKSVDDQATLTHNDNNKDNKLQNLMSAIIPSRVKNNDINDNKSIHDFITTIASKCDDEGNQSYDAKSIEVLKDAYMVGCADIVGRTNEHNKALYDVEQMKVLLKCYEAGVDVKNSVLMHVQIQDEGYDSYHVPYYNAKEMEILGNALINGIEVNNTADAKKIINDFNDNEKRDLYRQRQHELAMDHIHSVGKENYNEVKGILTENAKISERRISSGRNSKVNVLRTLNNGKAIQRDVVNDQEFVEK